MKSIDPFVYQEMLTKFLEQVWDIELTEDQQKQYKRGSEQIWNITEVGNSGKNFFVEFFCKDFRAARDHFTRKIPQYGDKNIPIKPVYLKTILRYIGVEPPRNITPRDINTDEKESIILYNVFEKDILNRLNEKSYPELSGQTKGMHLRTENEGEILDSKYDDEVSEDKASEFAHFIKYYIDLLRNKKYSSAYDCWLPRHRDSFWHSALAFERQFFFTRSIHSFQCLSKRAIKFEDSFRVKCRVYYVEGIQYYSNDEYDFISQCTFENINEFSDKLRSLYNRLNKSNFKKIRNIRIVDVSDIFLTDIFATAANKFSIDSKTIEKIFPSNNKTTVPRLCDFIGVLVNDRWYLTDELQIYSNKIDHQFFNLERDFL